MADDEGYKLILDWAARNGYEEEGNYDYDTDSSLKDNFLDLIEKKGDGVRGKGFAKDSDGLNAIEERFGYLRDNFKAAEDALDRAESTEQISEVQPKAGIKSETLNQLKTQRGRLIRTQRTLDVRRQELADVNDLDTLYQKYRVSKRGTYKTLMRRFDVEEEYARERALELGLRG